MVDDAVCSVPSRYTVSAGASGSGVVAAVGGTLQTPSGASLLIVTC